MADGNRRLPTISNDEISEKQFLARGSFGEIYTCKWRGNKCAMKVLRDSGIGQNSWAMKKLINEIMLLRKLGDESRLFVKVHCLYINDTKFAGYLMEYCELGDLRGFLNRFSHLCPETTRFPWLVYSFLLDVCKAMKCLQEDQERPVLHKDLAIDNILIASDFRAKLSDFGLSKKLNSVVSPDTLSLEAKLGVERRPPELMQDPLRQPDQYVDRFLFGICLCEALICASLRHRMGSSGVEDYKRLAMSGGLAARLRTLASEECFDLYPVGLRTPAASFERLRAALLDSLEAALCLEPEHRPAFSDVAASWGHLAEWSHCVDRERDLVRQRWNQEHPAAVVVPPQASAGVAVHIGRADGGYRRLDSGVDSAPPIGAGGAPAPAPSPALVSIGRVHGNVFVHRLRPGDSVQPSPLLSLSWPAESRPAPAELLDELGNCQALHRDWATLLRALELPQSLEDEIIEADLSDQEAARRVLKAAGPDLQLARLGHALQAINCHDGLQLMRPYAV